MCREVEVPLSENEQRLLEQMERALSAEDPKFASAMRGSARRPGTVRRLAVGIGGLVVGLALLLVAVHNTIIPLGVAGFLCMLAGTAYALSSRRRAPAAGAAGRRGGKGARRRGTFMARLEQRWDRRRDQ